MTFYDAYIEELDDPKFSWDCGDWNGNVPGRIGPLFPPANDRSQSPFCEIIGAINSGELEGKQTDWAGWVAKADRTEIFRFFNSIYDDSKYPPGSPLAHIGEYPGDARLRRKPSERQKIRPGSHRVIRKSER